jgi:mono/diheme cytochrome c family protein
MKNFLWGVLSTLVAVTIGALAYLLSGFAEVRADKAPGRWETALMRAAVHASVRREAPEQPNPFGPSDENLVAGGRIYQDSCAGCHGSPGKKDNDSDTLFPPPPQFWLEGTQYTEAQIFWIGKHGIRRTGMFVAGRWNSDEKLWKAVAYIKRMNSLPPAVSEALSKPPAPN